MRKLFILLILSLGLCAYRAFGQDVRPQIGAGMYYIGGVDYSPNGQPYEMGFLSSPWREPMQKTHKRLIKQGASKDFADQFLYLAQQMRGLDGNFNDIGDRGRFGRAIDEAISETTERFKSCGSAYAVALKRVKLKIVIRDTIWQLSTPNFSGWVAGESKLLNYREHLYQVDAVCIFAVASTGQLVEARSMLKYEVGNAFALDLGYRPTSMDQEVGNRRPCDVFVAH